MHRKASDKATIAVSVLLLTATLVQLGCASQKVGDAAVDSYNAAPFAVAVPAGTSPEFVEQAMVETVLGRKWKLLSRSPEEVVAHLRHREYDATVTLRSNGTVIIILSDATHIDTDSGSERPGVPIGWLENIRTDLSAKLTATQ